MNLGALPFLDMKSRTRDATYRELLPAETTLITIKALIRCAAGRMPASVRAMVKGELAVFEVAPSNDLSLYGMRIPIKKMVPADPVRCVLKLYFPDVFTNVKDQNAPKNLLYSPWHSCPGVRRFSSGNTHPRHS